MYNYGKIGSVGSNIYKYLYCFTFCLGILQFNMQQYFICFIFISENAEESSKTSVSLQPDKMHYRPVKRSNMDKSTPPAPLLIYIVDVNSTRIWLPKLLQTKIK